MRYLFGCAFFLSVSPAQAQETDGGYVGVSVGSFDYRDDGDELGLRFSDAATSYRVLGGYQFNDYYVEAALGATGDIKESFRAVDPFSWMPIPSARQCSSDFDVGRAGDPACR